MSLVIIPSSSRSSGSSLVTPLLILSSASGTLRPSANAALVATSVSLVIDSVENPAELIRATVFIPSAALILNPVISCRFVATDFSAKPVLPP